MASAKLERLMNLTAALLHTSVPISAATIKARVEGYAEGQDAFRRQFFRDKDDLADLGVVIQSGLVPDSDPPVPGYRIRPDDYYLKDPGLDAEELAAMQLALRSIDVGGNRIGRDGLFKLGGMTIPMDGDLPRLAAIPLDPNLGRVFEALSEKREIRFTYHGLGREVVPNGLGFRVGHWYVSGWDRVRDQHRLFRLDRIENEVIIGERAEPPSDAGDPIPSLQPWSIGGSEPIMATVRVGPSAAAEVLVRLGSQAVVERADDGGVLVEVEVTNRDGFRSWVLELGASAEVVAPIELREMMREWLSRLAGVAP